MPRGVYPRSQAHKQKLREQIAAAPRATYVRTAKHRADVGARMAAIDRSGSKNPKWAADTVGYSGVHIWMTKNFGQPKNCETCSSTTAKRFDWANISGKYLRDRADWKRLCRSCHMKEDGRAEAAVRIMFEGMRRKLEAQNAL